MKYAPLIWAGLWRKPLRTTLTFLASGCPNKVFEVRRPY